MNMESNSTINNSFIIKATNVPLEFFENRDVAKKYFRNFGRVKLTSFKPKRMTILVEYTNEMSMQNALELAGEYNGKLFKISKQTDGIIKKKKVQHKSKEDPEWELDPEIRKELEAMGAVFNPSRTYEFRSKLMEVDPLETQQKSKHKWKSSSPKPKKKPTTIKEDILSTKASEEPLLNIMKQQAHSVEEKYRILDARDKLLRIRLKKTTELTKTKATQGTCPDMCPEKERLMRETQHQVALYEQEDGGRGMNPKLAVKQYSRSSADQEAPLPQELRPVSVLEMTMGYLMHRIMSLIDTADVNVAEWYHFLWDRTRGIRKDITQQEMCCTGSVALVEQCARFHIFCSARLVAEDPSVFDQKINTENLTKCLQTLKYMYHDLQLKGVCCQNEAEFRAYIVLLNLNDGNFMWEVQQLREDIQQSKELKFAIEVYSSLDKNNYVKFFKLVRSTSYLNACILMRYFIQVRLSALKTLLKCYSPRILQSSLPSSYLSKILAFESIEATIEFVETYGLHTNEDRTRIILNRQNFSLPDYQFVLDRAINLIESKRIHCVGEVVCGKELPPKYYENHQPQNSFNERGYLIFHDNEVEMQEREVFERHQTPPPQIKKSVEEEINSDIFSSNKTSSQSDSETTFFNKFFPNDEQTSFNFFTGKETTKTAKTTSLWSGSPTVAITPVLGAASNRNNIFGGEIVPLDEVDRFQTQQKEETNFEEERQIARSPSPNWEEIRKQQEAEEERERLRKLELEKEKEIQRILEEKRLKEEIEKKKQEERLKKLKEEREIEEMRKKLIEEQKKRLEKQELIKAREIQNGVETTLSRILDFVEEKLKTEKLFEIKEKMRQRKLQNVVRKWKDITRRKRKRKAIDFNPVWCGVRSVQEEAEELRHSNRFEFFSNIKRYKTGHPSEVPIPPIKAHEKLELAKLTQDILIKRSMELNHKIQSELFWKVTISLPDSIQGLNFIESSLDNWLKWKQVQSGTFLIEQSKTNPTITYCLEKQKGVAIASKHGDSNGFIFFAKKFTPELRKRIGYNLKNFGVFVKLPLVVIVEDSQGVDENLFELQSEGIITDYLIVEEKFTSKNMFQMIKQGLVFLANRITKNPPVELDTFRAFLTKHFCDIWKRIASFSKWNSAYRDYFKTPSNGISIHNQTIQHLKSIILDKSCGEYAKFPEIFKECLRSDIPDSLPCDFKYFPQFWNNECYLEHLEHVITFITLPNFVENWPPRDCAELQASISNYCSTAFKEHHEKPFYKIMSLLLQKFNSETDFARIKEVSWIELVELIALEKVNQTDFSLYGTGFVNKSIFNQLIVVYNVKTLNDYMKSDWFYVNHPSIRCNITSKLLDDKNEKEQLQIIEIQDDNCDIDALFAKTFSKPTYPKKNVQVKSDLDDCQKLLKELEDTLSVHKKILEKSGDYLRNSMENN